MTTPERVTSNKAALRASLKKEDESLGARLAAAEVPLVPEAEAPAVAASSEPVVPATEAPAVASPPSAPAAKQGRLAKPAKRGAAKAGAAAARRTGGDKKTQAADRPIAEVKPSRKKSAEPAKPGKKAKAPAREPQASAAVATDSTVGKLKESVEQIEKTARAKGDKLVRYSVELLKSELSAIEALRADLAKAAGWAASRSDIVRAGVRVFAEQKLEQMKSVLAALAPAKAKKKG